MEGIASLNALSDAGYSAQEEYKEPDELWLRRIRGLARDPEKFQAGGFHAATDVLVLYFQVMGTDTSQSAKAVLKWAKEGYHKIPFVGVSHPSRENVPQKAKKEQIARSMLEKVVGADKVGEFLSGTEPRPIQFPNHRSAFEHADFVDEEIEKCLLKGGIRERERDSVVVVNGLLVVEQREKLRLCTNAIYPNQCTEHFSLRYERLSDLPEMIEIGNYLTSSDDKHG